eukprot:XP_001706155.1 Hypothetical protein GL50803_31523 [Giardia lamblia ATCC 50803]
MRGFCRPDVKASVFHAIAEKLNFHGILKICLPRCTRMPLTMLNWRALLPRASIQPKTKLKVMLTSIQSSHQAPPVN